MTWASEVHAGKATGMTQLELPLVQSASRPSGAVYIPAEGRLTRCLPICPWGMSQGSFLRICEL